MKKFFKNNLKTILAVGATAVICISGTAFAAFQCNAEQVEYKDGKSVETALNDLYSMKDKKYITNGLVFGFEGAINYSLNSTNVTLKNNMHTLMV